MSERVKKNVKTAYKWLLSLWTVGVGIAFILQVVSIYQSTPQNPYTTERIESAFQKISLVFWVWLMLIIGGEVLFAVFPEGTGKVKGYIQVKTLLLKMERRLPIDSDFSKIKKQRVFRLVLGLVCLALCLVSFVVSLFILLDTSYTPKFKGDFFASHGGAADRLLLVMPWVIAAFLSAVAVSVLYSVSEKEELELMKAELLKNVKNKTDKRQVKSFSDKIYEKFPILKSDKLLLGVRVGLGVVGVVFVVLGIANGGMADVLAKAVEICTQCIGLG